MALVGMTFAVTWGLLFMGNTIAETTADASLATDLLGTPMVVVHLLLTILRAWRTWSRHKNEDAANGQPSWRMRRKRHWQSGKDLGDVAVHPAGSFDAVPQGRGGDVGVLFDAGRVDVGIGDPLGFELAVGGQRRSGRDIGALDLATPVRAAGDRPTDR